VNINQTIRAREVRVVGANSEQLGILPLSEALALAEGQHLDLVEVSPTAVPPVCRIMDYGKFKYQQSKKLQEAKKKQIQIQLKEIKLRPKTDEHDLQFKIKHARRFIEEGNKAKVTVVFRGREITHMELGQQALDRFVAELQDISNVEVRPKMEGRSMFIIIAPKK
jgi:translation initiation factor IF-3